MHYHQITPAERYTLSVLRKQHLSNAEMARFMGRHRSTIGRELRRNRRKDGGYRHTVAQEKTSGRRRRSRRNSQFSGIEWELIETLLRDNFSPEQISGWLKLLGLLEISHQTIYRRVKQDRKRGGTLWKHLRQPVRYRKSGRRPWMPAQRSGIGKWTWWSARATSTAS